MVVLATGHQVCHTCRVQVAIFNKGLFFMWIEICTEYILWMPSVATAQTRLLLYQLYGTDLARKLVDQMDSEGDGWSWLRPRLRQVYSRGVFNETVVTWVVWQDTILWPIMLILYINYTCTDINFSIHNFVDDCVLW